MTGMGVVVELRRAGVKPSAVFVGLVERTPADPYALSPSGIVSVDIAAADSLADIDFRPLVGLQVHVTDFANDVRRQRRVAAMVARVEPKLLVVPIATGDSWVVHRRFAGNPPTTDRTPP